MFTGSLQPRRPPTKRQPSDSPQKLAIRKNCTTRSDASRGANGAEIIRAPEKSTLHQGGARLNPARGAVVDRKLGPIPQRSAREFSVAAKRIEAEVELQELG